EILAELGCGEIPVVNVLNKSDLVEYDIPEDDTTVKISAKSGEGIERMLSLIAKNLPESSRRMKLLIPYDKAGLGAEIRSSGGKVFGEEYSEKGILTDALVDITLIKKLEEYEIK
ncbi:MAG: GTPase HflX, partial [Ruminiclostridium sp.]